MTLQGAACREVYVCVCITAREKTGKKRPFGRQRPAFDTKNLDLAPQTAYKPMRARGADGICHT